MILRPSLKKLFTFKDRDIDEMFRAVVDYFNRPGLSLPVYADNAAAIAGGMEKGMEYRTATGQRMVVY